MLRATGLDQYAGGRIDGVTLAERRLPGKPEPDSFLAGVAAGRRRIRRKPSSTAPRSRWTAMTRCSRPSGSAVPRPAGRRPGRAASRRPPTRCAGGSPPSTWPSSGLRILADAASPGDHPRPGASAYWPGRSGRVPYQADIALTAVRYAQWACDEDFDKGARAAIAGCRQPAWGSHWDIQVSMALSYSRRHWTGRVQRRRRRQRIH